MSWSLDEKVVETKACKHCKVHFDITDKDLAFYEKVSPNFGGKKYLIPTPSLCPDCRQQRRLTFRNERKLYKTKCDATGEMIVSIHHPQNDFKVYQEDYRWSDKWNVLEYGRDFDFTRPFFDQFQELLKDVPKIALTNEKNENSPYANYSSNNKNIHLCADVMDSEDVYFSNTIKTVKNSLDLTDIENSENCYECICSINLYNCLYTYYSQDCKNSIGLYACRNTNSSLFCSNLNSKQYYIFNKKSSKEEYETLKNACKDRKILEENLEKFWKLVLKTPKKNLLNINSQGCLGDNLHNSENCLYCFEGVNIKDCKYSIVAHSMNDCMDTTIHNPNCFLDYEAVCGGFLSNSLFNTTGWQSDKSIYCDNCFYCSHTFGCVGLLNKKYCVLNKEYTREEYEKLVPKIIEHMQKTGEWGEFFPASLSPFGYNESIADEYFPLNPPVLRGIPLTKGDSQSGVEAGGFYYIDKEGNVYNTIKEAGERLVFKWSYYEAPFPKVEKIIPASKLPNNIKDVPDDILTRAIECEVRKKRGLNPLFKIIPQELAFYRKHKLPIPKLHPDERHLERMKLRNPRKLYKRNCDKCAVAIQTTYAPDRPELVYCEKCYDREIY